MPAFDAVIRHWPTLDAFAAHLRTIPRPAWCRGLTNHNTYIPNELQWRGIASVESCQATYVGKGWSAGPHLFLAAEAPRADDRGIFQLTPIGHQGVHAGDCNDHLGIESVGDFDARPPSLAQYQLLLAVNRLLLQRWMLPPGSVNVHNECMPRTCPGRYLTGAQIRADLARPAPPSPKQLLAFRAIGLPIYQRQDGGGPLAGHLEPDEPVLIDATYANGMGHLLDGRGFVDLDGLRRV